MNGLPPESQIGLPLLDDAAMRQFVRDGYVQVHADFPPDVHREIYAEIEEVFDREGNPGNNILPRIPRIQEIYDHAAVRGALTSLLGPDYAMHPHRYCHLNPPGSQPQSWHKDDYIYDQNVRHHRCRWVMAFYYPQHVDGDMGPTGSLPGRQHHNRISNPDPGLTTETEQGFCGPAGTVTIVNFDAWHRKFANVSPRKRYMLKFQFMRLNEPVGATWDHGDGAWPQSLDDHPAAEHVWDWLRGTGGHGDRRDDSAPVPELVRRCEGSEAQVPEDARLAAAYELGACGAAAVPALMAGLRREAMASAEANTATSPANPTGGNPADLYTAHALARAGAVAVPALIDALTDPDWRQRSAAAAVLGNLGPLATDAAPSLGVCVDDDSVWMRRNAAESLGLVGGQVDTRAFECALRDDDRRVRWNGLLALVRRRHPTTELVPQVGAALEDEDRYTRFFAALALERAGTREATDVLVKYLTTSRWCPTTNSTSPY